MTLAQTTRWVPVPLPDGSVRYDWVPEPQPPSPDGRPGCWRVVPGEVPGYGSWTWFAAHSPLDTTPPSSGAPLPSPPAEEPFPHPRRLRTRSASVAAVAVASVVSVLYR